MTYSEPILGGLIIGAAAMLLLAGNGRIAGISGITWSALSARPPGAWRWLFLVGLVAGAFAYHAVSGKPLPAANDSGWLLTASAGLIVGFGVKLGNGCTSGHGVCGLGRRSVRSLVSTLTFMATAIVTVYVFRHVLEVI